jgi:asparagine synthase (glutamine-hydrolysing)
MWAIAIWDSKEKELFLSRDRFGIKPFYYAFKPGQFLAFASETLAFKSLEGFEREFNYDHLKAQQQDAYALEGRGLSIYKGIYSLLPGHCAMVNLDTKEFRQKRWYDITKNKSDRSQYTLQENADAFYALFLDSCKRRLISDVPVATALSGGLDSSSVYATVNSIIQKGGIDRMNSNSQQAFVATFTGLESDETDYAKSVVAYLQGKGNYIGHSNVNADLLAEETVMFDNLTNAPLYSVSSVYRGMRNAGITVSLDGHGVDEMLYGYKDMVYNLYSNVFAGHNNRATNDVAGVLTELYHPKDREELAMRFDTVMANKNKIVARGKRTIKNALRPFLKPDIAQRESYKWPSFKEEPGEPYNFENMNIPDRMVHNEFFQRTLPSLLRNFDFGGMANSVEIRMPFMDYRLVEFVYSLPMEHKIGQGFTKLILREAMKGKLPEDVRTRTFKVGIGSPWDFWKNGELKTWTSDMLNSQNTKNAREILGPTATDWELINLGLLQ